MSQESGGTSYLDLLISTLREHEKGMDDLVCRLEKVMKTVMGLANKMEERKSMLEDKEEGKKRMVTFKMGILDPEGKRLDLPSIGFVICERCGEHLGYFGDRREPVDSSKNTQMISLIKELHRVGHLLEDLLTQGVVVQHVE